MKRLLILILCLCPLVAVAAPPRPLAAKVGKALGFWKPRVVLAADKYTIRAGEAVTLTWTTWNATSNQWCPTVLFPYSNGVVIPLQGSKTVTPLVSQDYWVRAFRRGKDLNNDGLADGGRRSMEARVHIEVVP